MVIYPIELITQQYFCHATQRWPRRSPNSARLIRIFMRWGCRKATCPTNRTTQLQVTIAMQIAPRSPPAARAASRLRPKPPTNGLLILKDLFGPLRIDLGFVLGSFSFVLGSFFATFADSKALLRFVFENMAYPRGGAGVQGPTGLCLRARYTLQLPYESRHPAGFRTGGDAENISIAPPTSPLCARSRRSSAASFTVALSAFALQPVHSPFLPIPA